MDDTVLSASFLVALITVAVASSESLARSGEVPVSWVTENSDLIWPVCALLTMPLLAAATTIHDELTTRSHDVPPPVLQDGRDHPWRAGRR